jgi:hypothetical protein
MVGDNDYNANSGHLFFGPTDTLQQITVIVKDGAGHVALEAKDKGPVVDFILGRDK